MPKARRMIQKFILFIDAAQPGGVGMLVGDNKGLHEDIVKAHEQATGKKLNVIGGGFVCGKMMFSFSVQYQGIQPHASYVSKFMQDNGYWYATTGRYGEEDFKFLPPEVRLEAMASA